MTVGKLNIPSWLATIIITTLFGAAVGLCADVLTTQRAHESRISVEENRSAEVLRRLERIDAKLDRLLELRGL